MEYFVLIIEGLSSVLSRFAPGANALDSAQIGRQIPRSLLSIRGRKNESGRKSLFIP